MKRKPVMRIKSLSTLFGFFLLLVALLPANAQIWVPGGMWWRGNPYGWGGMGMPWGGPSFVSYSTRGSNLLFEEPQKGRILLKNEKEVVGYLMNYDLQNQWMEVMVEGEPRPVELKHMQQFEFYNPQTGKTILFVNGLDYTMDGVPLIGVHEVLVNGKVQLFSRQYADVNTSRFLSGFNEVRVQESIRKKEEFYMAKGNELFRIHKKWKDNQALFGEHAYEIELYVKENNLKFKRREDLIKIFETYNSML